MTCDECREAGRANRAIYDSNHNPWVPETLEYVQHPENCECTCAHEMPAEWEKMFRNPPPWQKKLEENPPL